jgi:hypothetical protein
MARRPSTSLRSDLAVCGVTIDDGPQPWPRSAAVGHLLVAGTGAALPIVANSKYRVRDGHLLLEGTDLGLDVAPVQRPSFHRLSTTDGTPYYLLANRHGADVLTISVTGARPAPPAALAQLAADAARLDGVRSVIITSDVGEPPLADVVAAVAGAVPDLPVQVQIPVPREMSVLAELKAAGGRSLALHVESAATVGRPVWREAVRLFGRNQVSTYVVVGTDTDPDVAVEWAGELIRLGVYPFVVPFRPGPGTLPADGGRVRALPSWLVADVTDRVAELLAAAGMRGADQSAGCAACGACSCLASAGG